MQFITRHILIAPRDPQRYSEIAAPDVSCIGRVPLDMLDTSSEIDEFSMSDGSYDKAIVRSELGGFSMQDENRDIARCNSELTRFSLQAGDRDTALCMSELSGFLLETAPEYEDMPELHNP